MILACVLWAQQLKQNSAHRFHGTHITQQHLSSLHLAPSGKVVGENRRNTHDRRWFNAVLKQASLRSQFPLQIPNCLERLKWSNSSEIIIPLCFQMNSACISACISVWWIQSQVACPLIDSHRVRVDGHCEPSMMLSIVFMSVTAKVKRLRNTVSYLKPGMSH